MLRDAGITGWRANHLLRLGHRRVFVDLAFPERRLAIEIDGYSFHSSAAMFQSDRERGNDFVLAGWRVLHFTWHDLTERPTLVLTAIRSALAGLASISDAIS